MRIAVLGGTFNPLHKGHVMLAELACEKLGYDRILFVPSYIPPHKIITAKMTAEDRLEIEAKRIRENYKDADIDEVKGDYIDGYVEGEYLWTHDNVYIEEQEIKLDKE